MRSALRPAGIAPGVLLGALLALPGPSATAAGLPGALEHVQDALEAVQAPSGTILLDRGLPLAPVDRLDGSPEAPAVAPAGLRQLAADLSRAARRGELQGDPAAFLERGHRAAAGPVPIGVVDVRASRIRPGAAEDGAAGVAGGRVSIRRTDAFEELRIFAAAPLADRTFRGPDTEFRIDRFLTNRAEPSRLELDLDDGRGFRPVRAGATVRAAWTSTGRKLLRLRATDAEGDVRVASSPFDVRALGTPVPQDTLAITATQAWEGSAGTGQAYVYLAPGHAGITNPVVILEGFDIEDAMFWEELYLLLNQENLLEDLRADGYDAIVLNFTSATDPIPRNGFVAVELIEQLKASIAPEQDLFVIGASMGGLVGRWALSWMEQQGMDPRTRTFVAFDTPHAGANIPLGVQYWLDFFSGLSSEAEFLLGRLDTPAARQMLLVHHTTPPDATPDPDPLRAQFLADLAGVGDWPAGPRRVAVANGSATGVNQGFLPGTQVLDYEYDSFLVDIRGNVWALPAANTSGQIFQGLIDYLIGSDSSQNVFVTPVQPWDGVPGGWRDSMAQMDAVSAPFGDIVALYPNHCFIPIISSLALDTTDPGYDVAGDPDLLSITPVDAAYFPTGPNQEHVFISPESAAWFRFEIGAGPVASPGPGTAVAGGLTLAAPFPNPACGPAGIRFTTARPGPVRAEIVDVRGRRLATLADGPRPAGVHELRWEADVPAGVYFVRVQAEGESVARRLVRLRN